MTKKLTTAERKRRARERRRQRRLAGKKGGAARAARLSLEQHQDHALKMLRARWGDHVVLRRQASSYASNRASTQGTAT